MVRWWRWRWRWWWVSEVALPQRILCVQQSYHIHPHLPTSTHIHTTPTSHPHPHPWQVAPDNIARALKVNKGALIQTVDPNSAAAKAGLLATRRGLGGIVPGGVWCGGEFFCVCFHVCICLVFGI